MPRAFAWNFDFVKPKPAKLQPGVQTEAAQLQSDSSDVQFTVAENFSTKYIAREAPAISAPGVGGFASGRNRSA
jgi:hypothetical protein